MAGPSRFDRDFGPGGAAGAGGGADTGADSGTGNGAARADPKGIEALHYLMEHLGELAGYASYYVAVQLDARKLQARKAASATLLALLGGLAGAAIIVTACILLVAGAAQGIAAALDGRLWAGNLIVGFAILLFAGLTTYVGLARWNKSSRAATIEKYEERKRQQRQRFGHDVSQRANTAN